MDWVEWNGFGQGWEGRVEQMELIQKRENDKIRFGNWYVSDDKIGVE